MHRSKLKWVGLLLVTSLSLVSGALLTPVHAANFGWDGGAGTNLWDTVLVDGGGVQTNWLSTTENVPGEDDAVFLNGASIAGPVAIDLGGVTRPIRGIVTAGVEGAYTFDNGTLELTASLAEIANVLFADNDGGSIVVNSDVLLSPPTGDTTQRFNVDTGGDGITVHGQVSTAQAAGLTTLMITSRELVLERSIDITGVISDGAGRLQLVAGLDFDFGNHRGVVRVTGDNTFTGAVTVNAATLEFDSIEDVGGPANALGQSPLADSTIIVGNLAAGAGVRGTLRYVGTGHASDRGLRLSGGPGYSAVVESSGSGPLVLTGNVTTNGNDQFFRLGGSNTGDNELAGSIDAPLSANVTSFIKEGPGKWTLSGDSPNLDNHFTVTDGELVVSGTIGGVGRPNVFALQTDFGSTLTLDGGSLFARGIRNAGTFRFNAGTLALNGVNSIGGGSFTVGETGPGTLKLESGNHSFDAVSLQGADDTIEITAGSQTFASLANPDGGTLTFTGGTLNLTTPGTGLTTGAGSIAGTLAGPGDVTKVGAGTLSIDGSGHTNSGKLLINEGVVEVTAAGRLSDGATVNVASGATLRLLTSSGDGIFGIEGSGAVEIGDATLILGNSAGVGTLGGTGVFSGTISDGPGVGDLEKRGVGTFSLIGVASHSGFTEVENGTLLVTGAITNTSRVSVPNGPLAGAGTLILSGGTINSAGKVTADQAGAALNLVSGSLTASQIDVAAGTSYNSTFTWTSGTIRLTGTGGVDVGVAAGADQPFQNELDLVADKTLHIDQTTTVGAEGSLLLSGGLLITDQLTIASGGSFTFNAGILRLVQDQVLDADRLRALDLATPLGSNRSFVVDGMATIAAPLTVVSGGRFEAGTLVNPDQLILAGGDLEVTTGGLEHTGEFNLIGGSASFAAASTNDAGDQINAINADLAFVGGLTNEGDLRLINSTFDGDLTTGVGGNTFVLGTTQFGGLLTLSDGSVLQLGLGDDGVEAISIADDATLDGTLFVTLDGGFTPAAGSRYEVITADSITDNGLVLAGAAEGLFDLVINGNSVELVAIGGLEGDYNGDGLVNAADYTVWRDGLGNGTFAESDYEPWATNYGASTGPTSTSVPEPTAVVFLMLGLFAVGDRGRRS